MTTRLLPHRTTHNRSAFRWSFANQKPGDQIGQSEERKIPLTANENSKENASDLFYFFIWLVERVARVFWTITDQSAVERVAQVFWTNHRAKYSKNKAIQSYLQYSIENCYFSTSDFLEKCNFAFETKLTNIFIIMCRHRHLFKEGFTQLTGFTKINSSLARRTRNLSKQKISKKRLKTAHDPSGSPWWTLIPRPVSQSNQNQKQH